MSINRGPKSPGQFALYLGAIETSIGKIIGNSLSDSLFQVIWITRSQAACYRIRKDLTIGEGEVLNLAQQTYLNELLLELQQLRALVQEESTSSKACALSVLLDAIAGLPGDQVKSGASTIGWSSSLKYRAHIHADDSVHRAVMDCLSNTTAPNCDATSVLFPPVAFYKLLAKTRIDSQAMVLRHLCPLLENCKF